MKLLSSVLTIVLLLISTTEIRNRPHGYAVRLPSDTTVVRCAAMQVADRSRALPFVEVVVHAQGDDSPVWVHLFKPRSDDSPIFGRLLSDVQGATRAVPFGPGSS